MRYLPVFFLTCCICAAQSIAIGAIGGGRVTDDVASFNTPEANQGGLPAFRLESRFYDVGPTIEIGLPHGLSVEFDALGHRQGFFYTFYSQSYSFTTYSERDNTWEFPLLLKYKLRWPALNPFVEAGVAPRTMSGRDVETSRSEAIGIGPPFTSTVPASYSPSVGFVAGGGLQFNLGRLRLAPQVRYTRWFTTPVSGYDGSIFGGSFSSNLNQVDVLFGISWRLR